MINCINKLLAEKQLTQQQADKARDLYNDLEEAYRGSMGPNQAAQAAQAEAMRVLKMEAAQARRQALLQIQTQRGILKNIQEYRTSTGKENWAKGAVAIFDREDAAHFSNLEGRRKAILGRAHGHMVDVLATFRHGIMGKMREPARMANLVREAFGEATKDASAGEMAKAWGETAEWMRLKFNAAGGDIAKRDDWGLPQQHDFLAVRKASYPEWRDFIQPLLNPAKMVDEATGAPFGPEALELALRNVYETIRSEGWNKITPSGAAHGAKLANSRLDHRFLAFKDADSWMSYQTRFGHGSIFDVMMGHLDRMSRDISALETLGPNPTATIGWLNDTVMKHAVEGDNAAGAEVLSNQARASEKLINDMYSSFRGTTNAPINAPVGRFFAGLRSGLQSAQLGGAALSAISDLGFQYTTARFSKLPYTGILKNYLKLMTPGVTENQKLAVRLGLIAENWSQIASGQQRYLGEVSGPEIAKRLADVTMRLSGLSPWTQAGKWAFGMEFLGHLADQAGKPLAELPDALRNTLARYGMGAEAWDVIRATPHYMHQGASFLRPDDVAGRADLPHGVADDLATRMLEMVQTETEFAVPSNSLKGKVALIGDTRPGTFMGEVLRSALMYKNFGVTLFNTHVMRALTQKGALSKAGYAANLIIGTTILGGLGLQMKQIAGGKDPRPMNTPDFWGASLLQGGGLGIFGDFMFSNVNRFGGSLAQTLAGPVVSAADDTRRLLVGNALQLPGDKPTNFGRELTGYLRRYTPGGSIWYASLAFQRLLWDQMQAEIDPGYRAAFRRISARAHSEFGQGYWWQPGEAAPNRAPDLSKAGGKP